MDNRELDKLFSPVGVAVYGASSNPNKLGGRPVRNLLEQGYPHGIYPINPNYDEIQGLRCYAKVKDIGKRVDAAVILVRAEDIPAAVEDCCAAGVKLGVILSSGFGELGEEGKQAQKRVAEYAINHGMRLVGPNCLGVVNFTNNTPLTFSVALLDKAEGDGNMAIVSQSGAFGSHLYGLGRTMGISLSYWFTTGNEADLQLNDCLYWLADKPEVRSIASYMEDARDGKKLLTALEECRRHDKPVVMLKVGKTELGSKAASSHTGALAGNAAVYRSVFKQKNVITAEDVYELLDFSSFCANTKPVGQARVAIVTVSGGVGVLHADKCDECGLKVATLSEETKEKIRSAIPAFGSAENPIDVTAQTITRENGLVAPLSYCMEDENVDVVMMYLAMYKSSGERIAKQFIEVAEKYNKPLIVTWMAGPEDAKNLMRKHGILVFDEPMRAVKSLGAYYAYIKGQERYHSRGANGISLPELDMAAVGKIKDWLKERRLGDKGLSEYESRRVLEAFGFPLVPGGLAVSADDAVRIAGEIGYPVVMKIDSPKVLHKSDVGGVVLNVKDESEVREGYERILDNVRKAMGELPPLNGILVEKMEKAEAELLIGSKTDPMFGPTIAFGVGGIFVEVLKEISLRVAPLTEDDAHDMLSELKGAKLLDGVRGKPPCDKEAVYRAILCLSRMAVELKGIVSEVDINPLFAFTDGVRAGDALVVLE